MTTQVVKQAAIQPLFLLGLVVAAPGALAAMGGVNITPFALLNRHQAGDWGELSQEDRQENNNAVNKRLRIFSTYRVTEDVKFWVITEADRSATMVLLPEEY